MNKYIIASCLIITVLGWAFPQSDMCSCDQNVLQDDCKVGFCKWNSTTSVCMADQCSDYTIQYKCLLKYENCYWNSTACLPFTNCQSLSGKKFDDCQNQNVQCQWISGSNCVDYQCNQYDVSSCPYGCKTTQTSCEAYTSCQDYPDVVKCPKNNVCAAINDKCTDATCESQGVLCSNIISQKKGTITPCFYNGETCQEAKLSDLNNSILCREHTNGVYHWSSTNSTDGSCISCEGFFISAILALTFLLV